jgi:hypothetical protein
MPNKPEVGATPLVLAAGKPAPYIGSGSAGGTLFLLLT